MKYIVYSDSQSRVPFRAEFNDIDQADEFASFLVHQYDGKTYRVILHLDDEYDNRIDTYENLNSCDL